MLRRPFLILLLFFSVLVSGAVVYVQSAHFSNRLKSWIAQSLPERSGIRAGFTELAVRAFPPGIAVHDPNITLEPANALGLPPGNTLKADRLEIGLNFLQLLTGNLRVSELLVVGGDLELNIPGTFLKTSKSQGQGSGGGMTWDRLLQARLESVVFEETRINLHISEGGGFKASDGRAWVSKLWLGQWSGKGGLGYQLAAEVKDISAKPADFAKRVGVDLVQARLRFNALGARVDEVMVQRKSASARVKGFIKGDIFNPKGLIADLDGDLNSEVASLLDAAGFVPNPKYPVAGSLQAVLKMRGNLQDLRATLKLEAEVEGSGLKYGPWEAERLGVRGEWISSESGGEISVQQVFASSPERERTASRLASGGKVTVEPFRFQWGSREPITVSLKLERAHIHWFAASEIARIYGLGFRATGPVEARLTLPSALASGAGKGIYGDWSALTKVDLRVDEFQLDGASPSAGNGPPKQPYVKILKVPGIRVSGGIHVDSTGLEPVGITASTPHGRYQAAGRIDFDSGFDLTASGSLDLQDIGQIAEQDIEGDAEVTAHVRGPFEGVAVDFDLDVKRAYYVKLFLGEVRGRMTFEEDPRFLWFKGMRGRRGRTLYTGEGKIELKPQTIALNIDIPGGELQDVLPVFNDLTEDLSWFPRSLTGGIKGAVKIGGGLGGDLLEVTARATASHVDYLGERFREVRLTGGYDKGKFYASEFVGSKHQGQIVGEISFESRARVFNWDIRTERLALSDFSRVARLDVPVRGRVQMRSLGHGKLGEIESSSELEVTDVMIRGIPMPPSSLRARSSKGVMGLKGTLLGGQASIDGSYDFRPGGGASELKARATALDFSPVLLMINPRLIRDPGVQGLVSGGLDLSFKSGSFERATGTISLSEYRLGKEGLELRLAEPVDIRVQAGNFSLPRAVLEGDDATLALSVESRDGNLDGTVKGDLSLKLAEVVFAVVTEAEGSADLDLGIGGTLKAPTLNGRASVEGASIRTSALDAPIENINATAVLRRGVLTLQSAEGELANGRLTANGSLDLYIDRLPGMSLRTNISGSRIKVFPFQYAQVSGLVRVHGDAPPWTIDGTVSVDSALSRESVYNRSFGKSLKAAKYTPSSGTSGENTASRFKLDLDVVAEKNIWIKNELIDAEVKSRLKLVNTIEAPRPMGKVDLIQGKLTFKDRVFNIQEASGVFDSPTTINPSFNLTAVTEVSGRKIQLYSAGRLDDFKIEFSSNPAMQESEILSLLAVGATTEEMQALKKGDRSATQQGEAASLLLHSLDFNRDIQDKTGFQLQLDEAVNTQAGSSIFRPRSETENTSAPKIVLRRRLSKDLSVTAGSTFGAGGASEQEFNIEYDFTQSAKAQGVWNNSRRVGETDTTRPPSWGLDFKLQKRFKIQ